MCTNHDNYYVGMSISKSGQHRYTFHRAFPMHELQLILPTPQVSGDVQCIEEVSMPCSFILRGKDKAFEVFAKSPEDASSWIDDLIRLKVKSNLDRHVKTMKLSFYTQNKVFSLHRMCGKSHRGSVLVRHKRYSFDCNADLSSGVVFESDLVSEEVVRENNDITLLNHHEVLPQELSQTSEKINSIRYKDENLIDTNINVDKATGDDESEESSCWSNELLVPTKDDVR